MQLSEKRDLIKRAEGLIQSIPTVIEAKDVILRLMVGWSNDLKNSPEIREEQYKIEINSLIKSLDGMTIEEVKVHACHIKLVMGKIMKSGMELFNECEGKVLNIDSVQCQIQKHLDLLETIFDIGKVKSDKANVTKG